MLPPSSFGPAPGALLVCLGTVAVVSAAFSASAARGMPVFRRPLRLWGQAMLFLAAAAAALSLRQWVGGSLVHLLPHLATLWATALLGSAAAALDVRRRHRRPRWPWWLAAGAGTVLLAALALGASRPLLSAIGSGALALAFGLTGLLLASLLRLKPAGLAEWVLCLSSVFVATAFALWAAAVGLQQPVPHLAGWPAGELLLAVGVTCAAIGSLAFFSVLHERQRIALRNVYQRDSLTGLYIRGEFFRRAQAVLEEARPGDAITVLMVDLDHFKRVNDTYGHIVGDQVIAHAARLLQAATRLHDLAGRYGGEEFCLLLRNCDAERAQTFARRLLRVAEQPVSLRDGRSIAVTLSVGYLAIRVQDLPPVLEVLLDRADQALLRAKAQGRARAVDAQTLGDAATVSG